MGTPRRMHRRRHSRDHHHHQQNQQNQADHQQQQRNHQSGEETALVKNGSMFSQEQQKVIIEHLLITKNNAPQKNYSHVPCKFYRQGACQAGQSCPFSHSLDALVGDQTPCEYFKKGNCKFGSKCANAHITQDGVDVRKPMSALPSTKALAAAPASAPPPVPSAAPRVPVVLTPTTPLPGPLEQDVFEDEEYFLPNDFSDLLTPEELIRRRSRSSSSSTSWKPEAVSAASSYTSEPLFHQRSYSGTSTSSSSSSFASPLLHQQLAFFQAQAQAPPKPLNYTYATRPLQFKTQSPWNPPKVSSLASDLTRLRIDEEETPFFLDDPSDSGLYNI
ncbi:uncharacterized protein ZBIST_2789 [Zygosaccharomyces bailii]|nr:uncharacterized protein ZBIST_2789 [Zygosaccharomyces bailii]